MGEYWKPVNVSRREYIHPHDHDCGLKLGEWDWEGSPVMKLIEERWGAHDTVVAVSDYENFRILRGTPPGEDPPRYHDLDDAGFRRVK